MKYGPVVTKEVGYNVSIWDQSNSITETYHLLTNSETTVDGYLTAIEIFATDAGNITIQVSSQHYFLLHSHSENIS